MRFSRDKRGYENTFVVHSDKRRGRSRSRILYWFRTPPGVKVGRPALDEDAIRLIEEHNPDVVFDWTRILKGEVPPPEGGPQPPVRRRPSAESGDRAPAARPLEPSPPVPPETGLEKAPEVLASEAAETPISVRPTPAHARLGAEGVLRLRGRYSELLARITERVADPARQEELRAQAERLNPDAWVTDEEVRRGLEEYETLFESLRAVVGRRRRRRKRRSGRSNAAELASPTPTPADAAETEPLEVDVAGEDEQ